MAMLQHAKLKTELWAEGLHTAVYIINLSPSTAIGQQVLQALWSRQTPQYDRLCIFGYKAYVFVLKGKRDAFFLYGTDGQFGYQVWDPELQWFVRGDWSRASSRPWLRLSSS